MLISSLPDGYVYAYAEGDDAIKTSLRLKEVKEELTVMVDQISDNACKLIA